MSALQVAHKHQSDGEKALRTSLFKWSPDFITAAYAFEKAAVSFKSAGQMEDCLKCYRKAAHAHEKSDSAFAAAKCLEAPGMLLAEQAVLDGRTSIEGGLATAKEAAALLAEAAMIYREGGEATKAASCLTSRARTLAAAAETLPDAHKEREGLLVDALEGFLGSCEILEENGKVAFSIDTFRHTLNFVVKLQRWSDAVRVVDRMVPVLIELKQKSGLHKAWLTKVILQLKRNDLTAARNAFREGFDDTDYLRSSECAAGEDLVTAWERGDESGVQEVLGRQIFTFLERQVTLVARDLSIYNASADMPPAASPAASPAAPPAAPPAAAPEPGSGEDSRAALFAKPAAATQPASDAPTPLAEDQGNDTTAAAATAEKPSGTESQAAPSAQAEAPADPDQAAVPAETALETEQHDEVPPTQQEEQQQAVQENFDDLDLDSLR